MSGIFLWTAQSKIFVGGFLRLILRFLSTHMAASLSIRRKKNVNKKKSKKRKCLKVHLAADRSAAPRWPAAAAAAAAGEFLMAAQQRHLRPAAAAVAVGFHSAIRNTSQTRPNKDPYLAGDRAFEPDGQLFPSLCLASPRRGAPSAPAIELTRPASVASLRFKIPRYTWTPKIKSGFRKGWRYTTKATYLLTVNKIMLFVCFYWDLSKRCKTAHTGKRDFWKIYMDLTFGWIRLIQQKQDVHIFFIHKYGLMSHSCNS